MRLEKKNIIDGTEGLSQVDSRPTKRPNGVRHRADIIVANTSLIVSQKSLEEGSRVRGDTW